MPILYQHPKYELNGRWDSEIGMAQLWFPHTVVNTTHDARWKRREQSVVNGLKSVALAVSVELIPSNDLTVVIDGGDFSEIKMPVDTDKAALALVSARIELPDDSYTLEETPPDGYYYLDPETGAAIVPSASILLNEGIFNPLPRCAELIVSTYHIPVAART